MEGLQSARQDHFEVSGRGAAGGDVAILTWASCCCNRLTWRSAVALVSIVCEGRSAACQMKGSERQWQINERPVKDQRKAGPRKAVKTLKRHLHLGLDQRGLRILPRRPARVESPVSRAATLTCCNPSVSK